MTGVFRARLGLAALGCALGLLAPARFAGAAAPVFIRDAEIERTLHRVADPIFRAASVSPSATDLYLIQDPTMNAFVANGQNIYINTGMITRLDGIDELRGVIAHETGHIAGGHLARRADAAAGGRNIALLGMLGAAAAGIAGAPDAAIGIAAGSSQVARREMLAYSRGEEAAADQAGVRYVSAAGGDPSAILKVLRIFQGQEALMPGQMDPYAQTHPMSAERMDMLETKIAQLPKGAPPSGEDAYWYGRMVTKLDAFLDPPSKTLRAHPVSDQSEMGALARAIAYHRAPEPALAERQMEALIAMRPDDPYYAELKAQFLLEGGAARAAADAYRRAVELAPREPLILAGLGRALLNAGEDPATTREARDVLSRATTLDRENPSALRDLALAQARLGDEGAAALATAERFALTGGPRDVLRNATRAADLLPVGSPGWRRAQDMITMARRALKK